MQVIPFNRVYQHQAKGICAAIGVFDGVHRGHQEVIHQLLNDAHRRDAIPVVITFDKHPISVLNSEHAPKMIYSLETKLEILERYGVETVALIPFDSQIAQLSAEEFFEIISKSLSPLMTLCMGTGFVFARARSGNIEKLRELASAHISGQVTWVHEISSVCSGGLRISSTRIRGEILKGNLSEVSSMLGREYSLISEVEQGDKIGRTIGFPTANLKIAGRAIPPSGVYAVKVRTGMGEFKGCLNIGIRPTLNRLQPELRAEVHLLDFKGDLYGKTIEVIPVKRLRDEKKFSSEEELRKQIAADVLEVHTVF